jgi:hypothetical protein
MSKTVAGLFASLFLLLVSCTNEKEMPVTKEEALKAAQTISSSIKNNQPLVFRNFFNAHIFGSRIAAGSKQNDANRRDFIKGVETSIKKSDFGDQIIGSLGQDGTYELVKQYEKDQKQHLLFRLRSEDGGLNYHDFELTKYQDKVCIADIFIYTSGENLSKSIGDLLESQLSNSHSLNKKQVQEFEKLKELKSLFLEKKYSHARDLYRTLPSSMRNSKMLQVMYLQICSAMDEETYKQALRQFEANFSKEPYMFLSLIDAYIYSKDYSKALESVNKIDSLINKDPFLDYYRALLYNLMQKPEEARTHLEVLAASMPEFGDGALELISNYLDADDRKKGRDAISAYRENKKFNQTKLDDLLTRYPGYE